MQVRGRAPRVSPWETRIRESVTFFNHHNKRTLGDVVGIHEPTPSEPARFDIEVSISGSKDEVLLYSRVNCNRVERRRKYLACDPDWLAYAARTTGFEENEVKGNIIPGGDSSFLLF